MEQKYHLKQTEPDFQPVLFDKLRNVRNGSISIIKQDSKIIQINVCERIRADGEDIEPKLAAKQYP
jgi:hypothetical protein